MRRLKIMLHGQCFDGAASASLFARFYAEKIDPRAEIVYRPKAHARGPVFDDADFDADDHAVVDFRYAADPRLGWWFDHHASAFQQPGDEDSFRARPTERFFFDRDARSCTKLLATSLMRTYAWEVGRFEELVRWADVIDGAQFDSAEQAIRRTEPALRLATFVEHNQDEKLQRRMLDALTRETLPALAAEPWIDDRVEPVLRRYVEGEKLVRARIAVEREVAVLDLLDERVDGYDKFVPYLVAPQAKYVITAILSDGRAKIGVGMNPWNPPRPLTNIARICERYGGGGHAVVGGITLDGPAREDARRIAHEIANELRRAAK